MGRTIRTGGRLIIVAAAVLAFAAPVQAKGAVDTTITLISAGPVETFTSTGGALCPSGTASSFDFRFAGSEHGRAGTFHLKKTLVCSDGTGTLTIRVNAATVFGSPTDQGGWSIVEGTGRYAKANGGGSLVGTYFPGGITDLYTGRISL